MTQAATLDLAAWTVAIPAPVMAVATIGVLLLPSLLFAVAVAACMRATTPKPGKQRVEGGDSLTLWQWNAMDTKLCYDEMFLQKIYRRFGVRYWPGMTIVDVGANIGVYALYTAKQCAGAATIHCFEPMKPMFDLLAKNAADLNAGLHNAWIHGGRDGAESDTGNGSPLSSAVGSKLRVTPVQLGCYHERKDVEFSFRPNCPVASTIDTGDLETRLRKAEGELLSSFRHYRFHWFVLPPVLAWAARHIVFQMCSAGEERVQATVIPLSDYIAEAGLAVIDILKIDVECAEEQVVQGIREEHWPRIKQLLIEAEDFAVRDRIIAGLKARGYACNSSAIRNEILEGSGNELSIVYAWRPTPEAPADAAQ